MECPVEFRGIQLNPMKSDGIQWNPEEYRGIQLDRMESNGTQRNPMKSSLILLQAELTPLSSTRVSAFVF